jgi:cytosine/adenosine deaminase-related metal-dependent hydrolase
LASELVIKGGQVVTMDAELGDFSPGDILIRDGAIAEVGPRVVPATDAQVVDAAGMIVLPGFIDSHRHLWQTILRGSITDWTIKRYIQAIRIHAARHFSSADTYIATHAGALDALQAGVTSVVDYAHNVNAEADATEALRALDETGVRAVWCMGMLAAPGTAGQFCTDLETRIGAFDELARERRDGGCRVTVGVAPGELGFTGIERATTEWNAARRHGALVTLHANATPAESGEIQALGEAELLDERTILVHCNFVAEREWELLLESGAAISLQAESEIGLASGLPVIADMRDRGLEPTIGVDTVAYNSGDMFSQMRSALQFVRQADDVRLWEDDPLPDAHKTLCREALAWATINGARAAGLADSTGSLTPGKRADLIMLDTSHPSFLGLWGDDPVGAAVLHGSTAVVDTVLVDGEVLKRDGRLVGLDLERVHELVREAQRRLGLALGDGPRNGLVPDPLPDLEA